MLTLAFEKLHREFIRVSDDGRYFIGARSGRRFVPLGFNYDHDEHYRLLEDYWHDEWEKVVTDMATMRKHGANVIRIHLQLAKFLLSPVEGNERELSQLDRLVKLADDLGLYLDLVGLCCYHSWEVPEWYDNLAYRDRWQVQAFFWAMIAKRYVHETAIFCFDLMNEPVVPGKTRPAGAWLGKEYAGKSYIQFITLEGTTSNRTDIAIEWLQQLRSAIRQHDSHHLITVGLVDWSLPTSPMKSGFLPGKIVHEVDFISAHLYPESGKPEEMIAVLKGFCVGKPVVIDETFQLKCAVSEHEWFLSDAARYAAGFMTFYTDFLSENIDDGRNEKMHDAIGIFKRARHFFARRT